MVGVNKQCLSTLLSALPKEQLVFRPPGTADLSLNNHWPWIDLCFPCHCVWKHWDKAFQPIPPSLLCAGAAKPVG